MEHQGLLFQCLLDDVWRKQTSFHAGLFVNLHAKDQDAFQYGINARFCALLESPINPCYSDIDQLEQQYSIIFTHQTHLLKRGKPFRELMFGSNWVNVVTDADSRNVRALHPQKTELVSFIGSLQHGDVGAYQLRRAVAEYCLYHATAVVDCFGKGIRPVTDKREALAPYCFSIAMENASSDYYFSEKLVDCLLMETVPIYYGCPGIGDLFDLRGLLTFHSLAELKSILESLSRDQYQQMLPFARENKERVIRNKWHSHQGIFERITRQLPVGLGNMPTFTFQHDKPTGLLQRVARRLFRMMNYDS